MILTCLAYFAAGVAQDFIIAKYYICLSRQQAWWAAGLATIITLFSVFVIEQIIIGHAFWGLLFYGFGTGAGTFWAIRKSK